jgi:hydrogenase nickel incorporation protein HypA/HybF
MHELSIALGILDIAEEEGRRHGGRVAAIHLKLGSFSGVVKEALLSAYELAREGTPLATAELVVEDVPLIVHCPVCDADQETTAAQGLCCPICGGPAGEVVQGRELEVRALEIEP